MMREYLMELAGKWTRPLQETIIWDEIGREPALLQEIALARISECCGAMMVGETRGEEAVMQQTEFSRAEAVDFDDSTELL
jgi:hypothetical protein